MRIIPVPWQIPIYMMMPPQDLSRTHFSSAIDQSIFIPVFGSEATQEYYMYVKPLCLYMYYWHKASHISKINHYSDCFYFTYK